MSKKFHIIAAAAFAAVFGGEPTSVRAQQAIWTGRHPDPNVTEASLSQQAVAIAYGHLPPITDEGTSGPPVAYVLGTYEATPGAFQMRVLAYHVDADQPQPQEPFATAVWPATPLGSIVARAMTTATDASGNTWVYVTGQVPSHWGADTITIRYPANLGSTGFWTQRFDNTTRGNDIPVSIAASAGYVAVAVQSSVANMGLDLQVLVYETNTGSYAVDPMVSRISTSHDEWPARVLIDSTVPSIPIVVVAGTMFDTQHFKFVTAAWNPATGLAVWSPTLHGVPNTDCIAMDMAITGTNGPGRAYVTGYSSHAIGNSALTSDYFTTAVSTANGSEPWTALANHGMLYDSPDQSLDQAFKVCTVYNDADLRWKVFVTGSSFANATGNDIVTIKYDDVYDHADQKWVNRLDSNSWPTSGYFGLADAPTDMAGWYRKDESQGIDREEIYITGYLTNQSGTRDYVTLKYRAEDLHIGESTRNPRWVVFYNGTGNGDDVAAALVLDVPSCATNLNNVFVTGRSNGGTTFDDFLSNRYWDQDCGP